jgi:hypothetical protein
MDEENVVSTMGHYSAIKENRNYVVCSKMELEISMLIKISQKENLKIR